MVTKENKKKISEIHKKEVKSWGSWAVYSLGFAVSAVLGFVILLLSGVQGAVDAGAEKSKNYSVEVHEEAQQMRQEAIKENNKKNKEWLKGAEEEARKFNNKEWKITSYEEDREWYSSDENGKEQLEDYVVLGINKAAAQAA